jgi:anionic cell wall polymer biosynthesis LytR-Cps2A-Psr (LCP) family protein
MLRLSTDLEREFGIEIDYWVGLDFRSAETLVDAVGGIDLRIPDELAIEEWWYSDDDVDHRLLQFPAGSVHLDGYHAVAFARLRALDDDLHRIKRQQLVLEAVLARAFDSGLMKDPVALWSAYKSAIETDVPGSRIPGLALLAKQLNGSIQTFSLADPVNGAAAVVDQTLPSGAAVLVGVPENISYWLERVFGNGSVESESADPIAAKGPAGTVD